MKRFLPLCFLLLPSLSYCQTHTPTCADLRECTVFTRSQDKHQPYRVTINGQTLTQTNLVTGDSTVWSIQWVEECGFIMKFLSGNDSLEEGQRYYLKKHAIALRIGRITSNYYLYDAYQDRIGNRQYATDTFWVHPH